MDGSFSHGIGHVRRVIRPALRGHLAGPTQLPVGRARTGQHGGVAVKLRTVESKQPNWQLATRVTPLGHQRDCLHTPPHLTSPASPGTN